MYGEENEHPDALAREFISQATAGHMSTELDMASLHPLRQVQTCFRFSDASFSEPCRKLYSILYPAHTYNPTMPMYTGTESGFILSPDIGWDLSINKNTGATINAIPCCGGSSQHTRAHTAGVSDTYSIPRASILGYESNQLHEYQALSGIDEITDAMTTNDSQLVDFGSLSWLHDHQPSTSEYDQKGNYTSEPSG
ncbi:hypothetical protein FGADI_2129 [Fusarium gaditjirri]|uniref:Uncharacterized protein n=1 Tax=Fusarium gaditjirri TaxID=282569 RepID=A0A8H4TIX7_9HYPO|nr:hypothetical protein FGADI_2129 [Fusarium gaditjirri]